MKTFEGEYQYRDAATAALAQQEQSKIQMLEGKMDYGNPKLVYSLYCKLLDKSVFKTYEGYAYLNHIHDFLTDHAAALTGPVPEINEQAYIMPVLVSELEAEAAAKAEELAAQEAAAKAEELAAKEVAAMAEQLAAKEAEVTSKSVAESVADVGKEESAEPAFAIENEPEPQPENVLVSTDTEQASGDTEAESDNEDDENIEEAGDSEEDELSADIQRIKQRNLEDLMKKYKRTVSKNTKLRELLMFQRIAILLLIIIVIVMLTIAKKSDSPTILNYREKIQNEYASWEQQLKEKEQELREREKKLSENN